MKYMKMLGLVVVAAAAMAAFVGATSASASVACTTNAACPKGHGAEGGTGYIVGDVITATASGATLTNPLGDVVCTHSEVSLKITKKGTEAVASPNDTGEVTSLTFTGCTRAGSECKVTTVGLPYHAEVTAVGGGNGTLDVRKGASGTNPGATVVCGFFINCTFSNTLFSLPITGGNPAKVTANKVSLLRSGGICPSEAFWDATYTATGANTSVFVR